MTTLNLALVGAPNSGKSTLFNGLTGGRAKVANYTGVTVETNAGSFATPSGHQIHLVDVPGIYGLNVQSTDERIALDLIQGNLPGQDAPDGLIVLLDAPNIRTHLHSVLQMQTLGLPMIVALNMMDLAERDGLRLIHAIKTALVDAE